jgi:predicted nucleic acid-binding protein
MTVDGPFFLDTNVLVYWIDAADEAKRRSARTWVKAVWENGTGRTSWQVLNEFYSTATKKLGAPKRDVRLIVEAYAEWAPVGLDLVLVQQAWAWMDRASIAYWDALILAAAESQGCRYLLSEDFQEGRTYGSVRVINPFHSDPHSFPLL